ncbi:MAG: hypothetical protein ABEJ31_13370 [Haloarculaceae archaeon]
MSDSDAAFDFALTEAEGMQVLNSTGTFMGFVVDADPDEAVLFVNPGPKVAHGVWRDLDGGEIVDFDPDWFANADYTVWSDGEPGGSAPEEWPFTVTPAEIDAVDDGKIRLVY